MSRRAPELRGRTAIVTGAASGIGRALALRAAAERMVVVACDVDATGLADVDAECHRRGVACRPIHADVTRPEALEAVAHAARILPPPALLFANAGVLRGGPVLEMPIADWRRQFEINVLGMVQVLQRFVPDMVRRGNRAQVVVTGSTGSMAVAPGLAAYCGTKHALWPITEALRDELAETPVGVSLLMPGAVATHIFDAVDPNRPAPADSITPERAADIAFAGALADQPLILTHPDFVARAEARFAAAVEGLRWGD
ncbi:MAG: SDR family NAD(P)-dependent oxidoreductase [Pseudomonadota bacterium]